MKPLYRLCHTLSGTIARIAFQYRAYGQENIIEEGPAIMAANHQSYLDPPLVGITCQNELYFLARKTLFEKKFLGALISRVNALPVDLSRGDLTAFRAVMNLLKEGHRTVIFPEGTRSEDGKLGPLKKGAFHVAIDVGAMVVPVTIKNAYKIMPKSGRHIYPGVVRTYVHAPIDATKFKTIDSLKERVGEIIASQLDYELRPKHISQTA